MSKGRPKGSGKGLTVSLSIAVSPAQREFLKRKQKETGAKAADYLRLLLDRDMAKEQADGTGKEAKND